MMTNNFKVKRVCGLLWAVSIAYLVSSLSNAAIACEFNRDWRRSAGPIFRSPEAGGFYEVASDSHVFSSQGQLWMIFSGDDSEHISIKLARANAQGEWEEQSVLLGPSLGHDALQYLEKETAFYHLAANGEHQIYFIGYPDQTTYESQIFLATSNQLEGPYTILPQPVVNRGVIANKSVATITSPSIMEVDGNLQMVFLGWDSFANVSQVYSIGATSVDNGRTWGNFQVVEVPIGMEGQITRTPSGRYVATRTGEYNDTEALFIACAEQPFGPYQIQSEPILVMAGAPWEVDEITGSQVYYDPKTKRPTLYYTGADQDSGWWILSATPAANPATLVPVISDLLNE